MAENFIQTQTFNPHIKDYDEYKKLYDDSIANPKKFINDIKGEVELIQAGSSLKLIKIAEGLADIYPRLAPTSEWDTAAANAILEGAGGKVLQLNGEDIIYGKEDILNPYFIASGIENKVHS